LDIWSTVLARAFLRPEDLAMPLPEASDLLIRRFFNDQIIILTLFAFSFYEPVLELVSTAGGPSRAFELPLQPCFKVPDLDASIKPQVSAPRVNIQN